MSIFKHLISSSFTQLLCRPRFFSLNQHLHRLALRSVGVLNAHGERQTGEAWLLNHLPVDQIKVVVDIGANTQVFGIEQFPDAQFYAFEPNPHVFSLLKQNTGNKPNVHLLQQAVSSQSVNTKLYDFADTAPLKNSQPTSTLASLNPDVIRQLYGQPAKSIKVKTTSLDDFCRQKAIKHIDLLKIDVEGFELEVLKGAQQLLKKKETSLIQFEFNETHAYQRVFLRDFVDLLPDFTLYRLSPHGLLPLPQYRPVTHEIFGFQNILAVNQADDKRLASIFD